MLNNDDYVFERWHGTLLVIAIVAFAVIFNTVLAKRLPTVESIVLFVHWLGFFGVLIPLWVLAPRNSPKMVFTQFENLGGWPTQGLSFMVGLLIPYTACWAPIQLYTWLRRFVTLLSFFPERRCGPL